MCAFLELNAHKHIVHSINFDVCTVHISAPSPAVRNCHTQHLRPVGGHVAHQFIVSHRDTCNRRLTTLLYTVCKIIKVIGI